MSTHHVTIFVFVVILHVVTCQVDQFELHDKERGDVTMHVTRDKAEIEAVSDSVSLVMNPQGAASSSRSFDSTDIKRDNDNNASRDTTAITRDTDRGGGYTIGNIDQPDITVKQNSKNDNNNNNNNNNSSSNSSSSILSGTSHEEAAAHNNDLLPSLPESNRFIHVDQDDYNVKRSSLPLSLFDKLPTSLLAKSPGYERKYKVYNIKRVKRRFRSRPPCYDRARKKTLPSSKGTDGFDILGDFNEIIEKSTRHVKRMIPNSDTRRDGELYNIHDSNQNRRVSQVRSCIRVPKASRHLRTFSRSQNVKDVNASKKSLLNAMPRHRNDAKTFSRLAETGSTTLARLPGRYESRAAKKSGVKEMRIHNELGAMHIKSNPSETAVISESGNIEITMLNDVGSSSKKGAGAKMEIPGLSSNRYATGTSRTLAGGTDGASKDNVGISHPKKRLHLAEDISLKKSHVNTNNPKIVNI